MRQGGETIERQVIFEDERGLLLYYPKVWSVSYFEELDRSLSWKQDQMRIFGRELNLPRLTAWYGDPGTIYSYSGIINQPLAWIPLLLAIKDQSEAIAGKSFNSVLANRYADGQQHQGYHADDEAELGKQPVIASVSFGATRRFLIKEKKGLSRFAVDLEDGSLLIMGGSMQANFVHALAKTKKAIGPRINLTFRQIRSVPSSNLGS